MSTGPLSMTWVTSSPLNARPRAEGAAPEAPPEAPAQASPQAAPAQDQSLVKGQGLLLEWAGSAPAAGSAGASSGLGLEWATASSPPTAPPPQTKPTAGGLGLEWRSAGSSSQPSGGSRPATGTPPSGTSLGLEWRSAGSTSAPAGNQTAGSAPSSGASNSLGLTWVGGSGSSVSKPDPEAERLAQLKTQLAGPLPAIPERPQHGDWRRNDLVNRADLIKAIRNDPALQAAFAEWDKLPNDAKMAAGNRLSALEGAIYGFEPAPLKLDAFLKKPSYGYYHPTEDKVHVSADTLSDLREFVNTVTHEQAHAYQWEKGVDAKAGRMDPTDPLYQTALTWHDNFYAYSQPNKGYQAYRTQPIEAHAFATGDGVSAGVFS